MHREKKDANAIDAFISFSVPFTLVQFNRKPFYLYQFFLFFIYLYFYLRDFVRNQHPNHVGNKALKIREDGVEVMWL